MHDRMMRSENFTTGTVTDDHVYDPANYGTTGPIQMLIDRLTPKFEQYWFPTLANLGIPENSNPTGGNLTGASLNPTNIDSNGYTRS